MRFCCVGRNVCVSSTAVSCWCSESVQEVKNATACATEAVTERELNIQNFHTSSTYLKGKLVVYQVGFITLWKFFQTLLSVTHTTNTAPAYIQQGLGGQLGSVKQPVPQTTPGLGNWYTWACLPITEPQNHWSGRDL